LTIVTVLAAVGLLVASWFIKHAEPLRFVVLFLGVMSALYSAWDIVSSFPIYHISCIDSPQCDDLILRKVNESDASVFAQRYGGSSQCWGVFWCIISLLFMACGIVAGLAAFPESFQEQEDDSKKFIPTR